MPFFVLKRGQDLENRAHLHQEFPGVPPPGDSRLHSLRIQPSLLSPCHLGPSLGRKPLSYADLGIRGTPCHPDQEGEGGGSLQKIFSALRGSVWSKNKGKPGTPGELGSPRDFLGGFDFCPYSIILVT